jgi:hypothetical protein
MRAATKSRLVAGRVGGRRRQASRCMCAKKHSGSRSPGPGLEGRTKADRTQARTVVRELSNARAMGLAEEATRGTQRRAVDDSRARGGSMSRRLCHVRREVQMRRVGSGTSAVQARPWQGDVVDSAAWPWDFLEYFVAAPCVGN